MPRGFPTNGAAEGLEIDGGDDEALLARKVPVHCLGELCCRGEVDIAVSLVDWGAVEYAGVQGGPFICSQDFVGDLIGHCCQIASWSV